MDPKKFHEQTVHLLRYSNKLERHVLIKDTTERLCQYCPKQVTNQKITCEAHRLGTAQQHFKHKCHNCRMTVFDGSFAKDKYTLRPVSHYTPKTSLLYGTPKTPTITKNGKVLGRPRNPKPAIELPKRKVGRPRKNPQ